MINRISFFGALSCGVALLYSGYSATENQGQQGQRAPAGQRSSAPSTVGSSSESTFILPVDGVTLVQDGLYKITDPRPVEQATRLLERKLGVPIWYEDPAYAFGDLVNAADLPRNRELAARNPWWRGPVAPRSGTIDVILPTTQAGLRAADTVNLLERAIASHRAFGNPGDFKVVPLGDHGFSVVGIAAAGKDGHIIGHVAPLDRRISFPEAERTLADTLDLICRAINVRLMVNFSTGPENSRRVRIGATNEIARDVLARTRMIPGGMKVSWILNYMPDLQTYMLGLRPVEVEVSTPETGTRLQTLFWPKQ